MGLKLSGDISTSGIVTSKQYKIGESSITAKTRIRNKKTARKKSVHCLGNKLLNQYQSHWKFFVLNCSPLSRLSKIPGGHEPNMNQIMTTKTKSKTAS